MPRVLVNNVWYEEVSWRSLYEIEFENILLSQAASLFPGYFLVPFKTTVCSDGGSAKADFALIEKGYRYWWVIEVELADHSLNGHVVPQVKTLANARYGETEALYLAEKDAGLDFQRLADMMKGRQPNVLVIVNGEKKEWLTHLDAYGVQLMVLELYRSVENHHAFWVRGGRLAELADLVSVCHFDPVIPRLLVIDSPSALSFKHGESVYIFFEDSASQWTRMDAADKVWLQPRTGNALPKDVHFELVRLSNGDLQFQVKK